jgi:hypothetical protein
MSIHQMPGQRPRQAIIATSRLGNDHEPGTRRRAHHRLSRLFAIIALVFGSANPVASASEVDSLTLSAAMEFRSTFGLTTDMETVTQLEADPNADRKYSVALSDDEVAEIDHRMAMQEAIAPMVEYGRSNSGTFGGLWVDQAAGGVIHFSFTSDLAEHQTALQNLAPATADVQFHLVPLTEEELDDQVERIARDEEFAANLGVAVHSVDKVTSRNGIDVFVEPHSDAIAEAFKEQFGPHVNALPGDAPELTACSSRANCVGPPIMAGVKNDWNCTVGFAVFKDGYRRFLTAGHCVYQVVQAYGWSGWEWFHSTQSLGLSTAYRWHDWAYADAGIMGTVSATVHSNRVYYSSQPSWFGINSQQGGGGDYQGYAICQSGQVSGYRCGTILSTNSIPCHDPTPPCGGGDEVHLVNQRKANYMVQVGDSGAPVISQSNTNMAVGLQSLRDSLYVAYYSHIGFVLSLNGVNAVLRVTN